nr:aspartate--tRNA ligase 2, cytoplasmic [Tanacetum cinerariifolium]
NTKDIFLVYGGDEKRKLRVSCYTDVGYLTDADDLKSQTGYVFVLNGGAVDWKSAKQIIFATSSAEAEYIAVFDASKEALFRQFLLNQGFCEMFSPKLTGTSQGGPSSIAQSPQFYNQMAICGDLERVFVVVPVFTSQDSSYKFTCLEVEMEIKDSYYEYLYKTLRLTFEQGILMLKEAGVEVDPLGDLNTESERTLGQLVSENSAIQYKCLVMALIATHLMFSLEEKRLSQDLSECSYLNFWNHVQNNVELMLKQYQNILISLGMVRHHMAGLELDWNML